MTSTSVLIVGGGVSGLAAAWQLQRHGVEALLLEGRPRLGGRVLTVQHDGAHFDLGPSWVWPGQPCVAGLLQHFGIATYEQFCDGDLLYQQPDGAVWRDPHLKPMEHALRVEGGIGALVEALAADLRPGTIRLDTIATGLTRGDGGGTVTATGPDGETRFSARKVALALPPRLAARLAFQPALDDASMRVLEATPTWMAGHAKFLAIYDTPFWHARGLSGDALSRRGPLAEIHDASPSTGGPYALFGFVGIDAATRAALTGDALLEAATAQLVELFGPDAATPLRVRLVDWSTEALTAAPTDQRALDHHPQYGIRLDLDDRWRPCLHLIGTETAFENGGLVEGALQQGFRFAAEVARAQRASIGDLAAPDAGPVHQASMGWDWLGNP
ncbi:MAG: flavin monoamine oxidase family protein [Vicinamibacterales bacterium]